MPEMDGYEATSEIRRRESESKAQWPPPPIIAMTANAMQEIEKALGPGWTNTLKPVKLEELRRSSGAGSQQPTGKHPHSKELTDGIAAAGGATPGPKRAEGLRELRPDRLATELVELFRVPPQREALREIEGSDAKSVERVGNIKGNCCGNM